MVSDNMFHDVSRDDLKSKKVTKTVAALAIVAASSAMFSACGEPSAVPMNDEFAGNSGQSADDAGNPSGKYDAGAQQSKSSAQSEDSGDSKNQSKTDTGNYKDGDYKVKATYGPVAEDSFDVRLSVANGNVSDVQMTPHPFTPISRGHMDAFSKAIPGKIVGKPLKDLHISVVAGASWTSDAFNKALDVARQEASIQSAK